MRSTFSLPTSLFCSFSAGTLKSNAEIAFIDRTPLWVEKLKKLRIVKGISTVREFSQPIQARILKRSWNTKWVGHHSIWKSKEQYERTRSHSLLHSFSSTLWSTKRHDAARRPYEKPSIKYPIFAKRPVATWRGSLLFRLRVAVGRLLLSPVRIRAWQRHTRYDASTRRSSKLHLARALRCRFLFPFFPLFFLSFILLFLPSPLSSELLRRRHRSQLITTRLDSTRCFLLARLLSRVIPSTARATKSGTALNRAPGSFN